MKGSSKNPQGKAVALYGGSFDPVHCAHLKVAECAQAQLGLDKVIFIPAAQSPLKRNTATASESDRMEMLRLATRAHPSFEVDSCEIERGGTSYAVDTVHAFCARHPEFNAGAQLYWILGADQFELLPQWHRIEAIAAKLTFAVLRRPGYALAKSPVAGLKSVAIDAPLLSHSSSEVRFLLARGRSSKDLLPAAVEAFISARGLYTDSHQNENYDERK